MPFQCILQFQLWVKFNSSFLLQVGIVPSKVIPRLVDNSNASVGELNPNDWDVNDVIHFLKVNDCAAYCDNFAKKVNIKFFNTYACRVLPLLSFYSKN